MSRAGRWSFVTALLAVSLATNISVPFGWGRDDGADRHSDPSHTIALAAARADEPKAPHIDKSDAASSKSASASPAEDPDKDPSLPQAAATPDDRRPLTLPLLLLNFLSSLPFGPFK